MSRANPGVIPMVPHDHLEPDLLIGLVHLQDGAEVDGHVDRDGRIRSGWDGVEVIVGGKRHAGGRGQVIVVQDEEDEG